MVEGLSSGLPVITPLESGASELVGHENSDWVVRENLKMHYYNLHTTSSIPQIPLEKYITVILRVIDNLSENQSKARNRATKALDIKIIANQYKAFMQRVKGHFG